MTAGASKPTSLRERQREQTHQHLLTVAAELFGTDGFNATSIEDIAKAAGAGRATVYSYFPTKEAILAAIVEQMWADAEELYAEFGALESWSRIEVRRWLLNVLERWEEDRSRRQAAMETGPSMAVDMYPRYVNLYTDALMRTSRLWEDRFSQVEARRRATMLISMLENYLHKLFLVDIEQDRHDAIDTLTEVWLDVLHAR